MRCSATRFQVFVVASLLVAPACLPAGEPPAGRQIWAGRDRNIIAVLPARSPDDGVTRVLTYRVRPDSMTDASLISVAPSGAVTDQPLVERWACNGVMPCPQVDSRGRLFVWAAPVEPLPDGVPSLSLSRIDLDTGARLEFGVASLDALSPSRRRAVVSLGPAPDGGELLQVVEDGDASPTELEGALYPTFVGEDLYYLGQGRRLTRLPAGQPPQSVREDVISFAAISTNDGPRILLRLRATDPMKLSPVAVLDPATGDERPLPPDSRWPIVSPDARWALVHDPDLASRQKFSLVEVATGMEEPFELPLAVAEPEWRANHAELWFQAVTNGLDRPVYVKEPGQPVREVSGDFQPTVVSDGSFRSFTFFTRDGGHLFSAGPRDADQHAQIFVGDVDPAGQRFPLNPPGTRFTICRELSDGRLVSEAFYRGPDRNDIYLIDPRDGATRLLGRDGMTVALGRSRIAALTHRVDQVGDLEVFDLDSGDATTLAKEFAAFAYVQPRLDGPDLARPGAPVVLSFRARFASPHDGFWLTTLP